MRLVVTDEAALSPAAADFEALLARVDALASRFRADSVLERVNARAGRPVAIPMLLAELIAVALDAAADSAGLVDPTVGERMCQLGYDRDFAEIVDSYDGIPTTTVHDLPRWSAVELDRRAGLITVPRGVRLDLGATAKPYIADLAARTLAARHDTAVLVELGGDVAVAGERAGGWGIRVAERAGGPGQLVVLNHGGIATSTTSLRRWTRDGIAVHHIVDPRTGAPASGYWRTASVYGTTAVAANTASTAAIVLGADALPWLEARGLAARLVRHDGLISATAGWPADELLAVAS